MPVGYDVFYQLVVYCCVCVCLSCTYCVHPQAAVLVFINCLGATVYTVKQYTLVQRQPLSTTVVGCCSTVELLPHWQHSRSTTCLQRHVAHEHVWIATQQVHCILNPCNKSGFIDASQGHYRFSETEHFQPCVVYDTRCIPAKQHICKAATCQRQPDFEGPASACTRPSAKMPDGLSTLPQAALELQIWLQQYPLSNSLRTPNQPKDNIQPACP